MNRIESIINSAGWRLAQQLVLVVGVPIATWAASSVADQLKTIQMTLQKAEVTTALSEKRTADLEAYRKDAEQRGNVMRERIGALETDVKILKERAVKP